MSEDHDTLLQLSGVVRGLADDIGEMRGEVRGNTVALNDIKLTLARNGINGAARVGGIAVPRWACWAVVSVVVLALAGALTLDITKAAQVAAIAKDIVP